MRKNILILLQYGNVVPFNWSTRGFRCFYCEKETIDCDEIKDHTKTKHKTIDLHAFIPRRIISKDVPVKIDITNLACKNCNQLLETVESLIHHVKSTHDEEYDNTVGVCVFPFVLNKESFKCVLCEASYDNFTSMLSHMYKMHIVHSYICQICGLSFIDQVRLNRHMNNSHFEHRCKICSKVFNASHKVDKHKKKIHGIQKKVECNLCSSVFENQYQLKVHMGKVHNVEKYCIKCEHCPKVCTTKGAMLLHVQSLHSGVKFECDLCEYKTGVKWMIKLHKRKHFGEKNYVCSICDRRFGRSSNLRTHMKVHTGNFGRVCRWCRHGFTDTDTLERHEKEIHYLNQC